MTNWASFVRKFVKLLSSLGQLTSQEKGIIIMATRGFLVVQLSLWVVPLMMILYCTTVKGHIQLNFTMTAVIVPSYYGPYQSQSSYEKYCHGSDEVAMRIQ